MQDGTLTSKIHPVTMDGSPLLALLRVRPPTFPGAEIYPQRRIKMSRAGSSRRANWRAPQTPVGGLAKRAIDVALASAMLLLMLPIMTITALLIRLLIGSPIIFRHERIGFAGKAFPCLKFRTMAVNADDILRQHLATNPDAAREWRETRKLMNDPRVNCLGRMLRKSSLDELPQLINVIRGDMSLVGPRPVVADELDRYGRHEAAYLSARPGITGLWQTSGRNLLGYSTRINLDRCYTRHWSIWLDFILLLKTVPAVLNFRETA